MRLIGIIRFRYSPNITLTIIFTSLLAYSQYTMDIILHGEYFTRLDRYMDINYGQIIWKNNEMSFWRTPMKPNPYLIEH